MSDRVDAKAVDAAREPEPHHVVDGLPYLRVAPVQVRLLRQERVAIVLTARSVERPGAAAEFGQPVVGRAAVRAGIAPQVPIAFGIVARGPAFQKPGMPVGYVVTEIGHRRAEDR